MRGSLIIGVTAGSSFIYGIPSAAPLDRSMSASLKCGSIGRGFTTHTSTRTPLSGVFPTNPQPISPAAPTPSVHFPAPIAPQRMAFGATPSGPQQNRRIAPAPPPELSSSTSGVSSAPNFIPREFVTVETLLIQLLQGGSGTSFLGATVIVSGPGKKCHRFLLCHS